MIRPRTPRRLAREAAHCIVVVAVLAAAVPAGAGEVREYRLVVDEGDVEIAGKSRRPRRWPARGLNRSTARGAGAGTVPPQEPNSVGPAPPGGG